MMPNREKKMIRSFRQEDIDIVMEIWLNTNVTAHWFVPEKYWQDNATAVKEMLPQSELYVYEEQARIQGFVGLMDDYIAGIFVSEKSQSKGIGKQLLEYIKGKKSQLTLSVYEKNRGAVKFYQREGFCIQSENVDENTGEQEYFMIWKKE